MEADLKILEKINKRLLSAGVKLELSSEHGDVKIGNIVFRRLNNPLSAEENEGIILINSSEEIRKILQGRGISYFDKEGNIFLNSEFGQIRINADFVPKHLIGYAIYPTSDFSSLSPTNLVSPNALSIIDVLYRLTEIQIVEIGSALKFCQKYHLSQSKLSQIMRKINTKSLLEFKEKLKEIPMEWWLFAFEAPATKRKMVNFFDVAKPYYSLSDDVNKKNNDQVLESIDFTYSYNSSPGPIEVAKKYGEILDNQTSLWISNEIEAKLKRQYKLVPGKKDGHKVWLIASVPQDVLLESIVTHDIGSRSSIKTNIIRSIWDLSQGESRLKEVRERLLKTFIYESR